MGRGSLLLLILPILEACRKTKESGATTEDANPIWQNAFGDTDEDPVIAPNEYQWKITQHMDTGHFHDMKTADITEMEGYLTDFGTQFNPNDAAFLGEDTIKDITLGGPCYINKYATNGERPAIEIFGSADGAGENKRTLVLTADDMNDINGDDDAAGIFKGCAKRCQDLEYRNFYLTNDLTDNGHTDDCCTVYEVVHYCVCGNDLFPVNKENPDTYPWPALTDASDTGDWDLHSKLDRNFLVHSKYCNVTAPMISKVYNPSWTLATFKFANDGLPCCNWVTKEFGCCGGPLTYGGITVKEHQGIGLPDHRRPRPYKYTQVAPKLSGLADNEPYSFIQLYSVNEALNEDRFRVDKQHLQDHLWMLAPDVNPDNVKTLRPKVESEEYPCKSTAVPCQTTIINRPGNNNDLSTTPCFTGGATEYSFECMDRGFLPTLYRRCHDKGVYKGDYEDNGFFNKSDPPPKNPFLGVCVAVNCETCWDASAQDFVADYNTPTTGCLATNCPQCATADALWTDSVAAATPDDFDKLVPYWDNVLWDDDTPPAATEAQAFYIWNSQCFKDNYEDRGPEYDTTTLPDHTPIPDPRIGLPLSYDPTPDFDYKYLITPVSNGIVSPPNTDGVRVDMTTDSATLLPGLVYSFGDNDGNGDQKQGPCYNGTYFDTDCVQRKQRIMEDIFVRQMETCDVNNAQDVTDGCGNFTKLEEGSYSKCPFDPVTRRFGAQSENCMQKYNKVTSKTRIPDFEWAFYSQFNYRLKDAVTVQTVYQPNNVPDDELQSLFELGQMPDQMAAEVSKDFCCDSMLKTSWKVSKAHLYKDPNRLPVSDYYYIGKYFKDKENFDATFDKRKDSAEHYYSASTKCVGGTENLDGSCEQRASRNPHKNCWRKFKAGRTVKSEQMEAIQGQDISRCSNGGVIGLDPFNQTDCEDRVADMVIKSSNSSQSSFKYSDPSMEYHLDPAQDWSMPGSTLAFAMRDGKGFDYNARFNCKMKIEQDRWGIYTTIELRGKEPRVKPRPNKLDTWRYEPRSLFLHCYYPTINVTIDPYHADGIPDAFREANQTLATFGLIKDEAKHLARLWEPNYRGYEKEGDDVHFYQKGRLQAEFDMKIVGGSVHDATSNTAYAAIDAELIGETVLVQVTPTWTDPFRTAAYNPTDIAGDASTADTFHLAANNHKDFMLGKPHWLGGGVRKDKIEEKGPFHNAPHYRWTLNNCVIRNSQNRPGLNEQEENRISTSSLERPDENAPFYNYVEVDLVKDTCFQNTFYARAMTKFALNKQNVAEDGRHGMVFGYEVYNLLDEFRRECVFRHQNEAIGYDEDAYFERVCSNLDKYHLVVDCDVKMCMRDVNTGELLYKDCTSNCTGFYDEPFVPFKDANGDIYPTATEHPFVSAAVDGWSTTEQTTRVNLVGAGTKLPLTEEQRTFNYHFRVYQTDNANNEVHEVWHTHPYFRVSIPPSDFPFANLGVLQKTNDPNFPDPAKGKWFIGTEDEAKRISFNNKDFNPYADAGSTTTVTVAPVTVAPTFTVPEGITFSTSTTKDYDQRDPLLECPAAMMVPNGVSMSVDAASNIFLSLSSTNPSTANSFEIMFGGDGGTKTAIRSTQGGANLQEVTHTNDEFLEWQLDFKLVVTATTIGLQAGDGTDIITYSGNTPAFDATTDAHFLFVSTSGSAGDWRVYLDTLNVCDNPAFETAFETAVDFETGWVLDNAAAEVKIYKQFELDMVIYIFDTIWTDLGPCNANPCLANIIQVGVEDGDGSNIEDQNPAIFISPAELEGVTDGTAELTFTMATNGAINSNVKNIEITPTNGDPKLSGFKEKTTVRISQLIDQNGDYVRRIYMRRNVENEVALVTELVNSQPLEIDTAKVYLGNPNDDIPSGGYQNVRLVSHDCEADYWFDGANCLQGSIYEQSTGSANFVLDTHLAWVRTYKQFELDVDVTFDSGSIAGESVACDPVVAGAGNCFTGELFRIGRYHVIAANSIRRLLRATVHLDDTPAAFDNGGAGYTHQNYITFETDDPDAADGTPISTVFPIDLDVTYSIRITQLKTDAGAYELKINIDGTAINIGDSGSTSKTMSAQIEEPSLEILFNGDDLLSGTAPSGEYENFKFISHDCDAGFIFNGRNCVQNSHLNVPAITNWFEANKVATMSIFKQYHFVLKVYFGDIDKLGNSDNSPEAPAECASETPLCGPLYSGNIFNGAGFELDVVLDKTPQTWVPSAAYLSGGGADPRMSKLKFKNQQGNEHETDLPLCEWIEIRAEQRIDAAGDYIETASVRRPSDDTPTVIYTETNANPIESIELNDASNAIQDIWLGKGVTPTGKYKQFSFYSDDCPFDEANYGDGSNCVTQTTTTPPPPTPPTAAPKPTMKNHVPDPNWALAYLAGAELPDGIGGTHIPVLPANELPNGDKANRPQWFATAEPQTYKTLTPWLNWADGLRAYRNCSTYQQDAIDNPGVAEWTNLDEFRCQLLKGVALNGPTEVNPTSEQNKDFHKQQILCTQEMVDNKDINCPQLNCCLGNCDPCFSDDLCTCDDPCPLKLCKTKVPLEAGQTHQNGAGTHEIVVDANGDATNGWEEIGR